MINTEKRKLNKLNFCIGLIAFAAALIWFKESFTSIFDMAAVEEPALRVSGIIYGICNLIAVGGLLFVLIKTMVNASRGKKFTQKLPFWGLAIYGMVLLTRTFVLLQALQTWANPSMWFQIVLGLFILGTSLFALSFGGKAQNILGFCTSAILAGYFAFTASTFVTVAVDGFFEYAILSALFVFSTIAYARHGFRIVQDDEQNKPIKEAKIKKVEKK